MGRTPTILAAYTFNQIECLLELHSALESRKQKCRESIVFPLQSSPLFRPTAPCCVLNPCAKKKGQVRRTVRQTDPQNNKIRIRTVLEQGKLQQAGWRLSIKIHISLIDKAPFPPNQKTLHSPNLNYVTIWPAGKIIKKSGRALTPHSFQPSGLDQEDKIAL